jgi:hypothetical protein
VASPATTQAPPPSARRALGRPSHLARARAASTALLLGVAGGADAQDLANPGAVYTPPGMVQSPSSPPPSSSPPSSSSGAGTDPSGIASWYRGGDLGFGVYGGSDVGGFWVEALADFRPLALGFRGGLFVFGGGDGAELALTAGVRFPLSREVRVDLLGDVGLALASVGGSSGGLGSSSESTLTTLPLVAARAGITWSYDPTRFLRIGAMVRGVPEETVEYSVTECLLVFCSTRQESQKIGGTSLGAYLTWGGTFRSGR